MDRHAEMPYQGFDFDMSPLYSDGVFWEDKGESWHVTAHITMPEPCELPAMITFHRDHSVGGEVASSGLKVLLATLTWDSVPSYAAPEPHNPVPSR